MLEILPFLQFPPLLRLYFFSCKGAEMQEFGARRKAWAMRMRNIKFTEIKISLVIQSSS